MRVLITGGSGFIGRYIVAELLEAEVAVRVCDVQHTAAASHPSVDFIQGDATDLPTLQKASEGVDIIIHLVGVRDAHVAQKNPDKSFRLNVVSLHNALEACRTRGVKRIVFPSTAAIYGRTDKIPVSEEDPARPTGIYAYHKCLCEEMLRAYRATYGASYTIFRLFNALGVGNKSIIDHCIAAANEGREMEVFGADQVRDFVSVREVASAFRLAALSDSLDDRTVNLGSGRGWTIRGVVDLVKRVLPQLQVRFVEKPDFVAFHSVADVTLLRTLLGLKPESSEALFVRTIEEIAASEEQ